MANPWTPNHEKLRNELARLYLDGADANRIVDDAGMKAAYVKFNDKPINNWHAIINEAVLQGKLIPLIENARGGHKENETLKELLEEFKKLVGPEAPEFATVPRDIPPIDLAHELHPANRRKIPEIREKLLSDKRLCVVSGMPGMGKKYLARHIGVAMRSEFPDGDLWLEISNKASDQASRLRPIFRDITEAYPCNKTIDDSMKLNECRRIVADILQVRRALIVINDVQYEDDLEQLRRLAGNSALLITTIIRPNGFEEGWAVLEPTEDSETVEFLVRLSKRMHISEPEQQSAAKLVKLIGGNTFGLGIIAAHLKRKSTMTFERFLRQFEITSKRLDRLARPGDRTGEKKHGQISHQIKLDRFERPTDPTVGIRPLLEITYLRVTKLNKDSQELFSLFGAFESSTISTAALVAISNKSASDIAFLMGDLRAISMVDFRFVNYQKRMPGVENDFTQQLLERYSVNALIRAFAREKLGDMLEPAKEKLLSYVVTLSKHFDEREFVLLDTEWEEIKGAMEWAFEVGHTEQASTIFSNLSESKLGTFGFLDARGYWESGYRWVTRLLSETQNIPALDTTWLHVKAAVFALRKHDHEACKRHQEDATSIINSLSRTNESVRCEVYAYYVLSELLEKTEGLVSAFHCIEQAVNLLGNTPGDNLRGELGSLYVQWVTLAYRTGQLLNESPEDMIENALDVIENALTMLPDAPTSVRVSALFAKSNILWRKQEFDLAKTTLEAAAKEAEQIGNMAQAARYYSNFAGLEDDQKLFDDSEKHYEEAIDRFDCLRDIEGKCIALTGLTFMYINQGKFDKALEQNRLIESLTKSFDFRDVKLHLCMNYCKIYLEKELLEDADRWLKEAFLYATQFGDQEYVIEINELQKQVTLKWQNRLHLLLN